MRPELNYFDLFTRTLDWLIRHGQVNEALVRSSEQQLSWSVPGSDLRVQMSRLGSGSFAFVWKAGLLKISH
jgi:hypothetical protein